MPLSSSLRQGARSQPAILFVLGIVAAVRFPLSPSAQESVRFTVYIACDDSVNQTPVRGRGGASCCHGPQHDKVGSYSVPGTMRVTVTPTDADIQAQISCAPPGLIASAPCCVDLFLPTSLCLSAVRSYSVSYLGNVVGGDVVRYINLPIEELKVTA